MDYLATIQHKELKLTRNPIVVLVDPVVLGVGESRIDLSYFIELRIQKAFQSSSFVALPMQEASEKPIPDGFTISPGAYFEIQTRLDDQLSATPPVYGDRAISVCPNLTRQYYVTALRYNGDELVDIETSPTFWAFRGQMAMQHYSMYKDIFFSVVFGGQVSNFLTWQPDAKLVREDQPERLYLLTNFSPTPQALLLRICAYYEDGTAETYTASSLANVSTMTIYCLPVGFSEVGLNLKVKKVLSYEVWASNENEQRLTDIRTFRVDRFEYESVRYLAFQNSLGGYDTIRCVGSPTESVTVNRQILERFTDYDYLPTVSEVVINSVTGERSITLNIGNWLNANYREYLEELLLSEDFYIVDGDEFIPLTPTFNGLLTQSVTEWPIERTLSFTYSNSIGGYSRLPKITPVTRPTNWRQWSVSCELDANGLRTGKQIVNEVVKYYLDSGENVRPITTKANIAGTEGYIPPWSTDGCAKITTPYLSELATKTSSLKRNDCGSGNVGSAWTISIPAGAFGSELNQADANAKASQELAVLDTQANANTYGSCTPAVDMQFGLYNNCPADASGYSGGQYYPIVALRVNSADAVPNTTYTGAVRYAETTFPAATYNIDIVCLFSNAPTAAFKIRIPSKNLTSPTLNGSQTYRFANLSVEWGDPSLIIIVEPA